MVVYTHIYTQLVLHLELTAAYFCCYFYCCCCTTHFSYLPIAASEAAVPVQQLQGVVDVGVLDHDAVFWFGDLNYRIDMPVPLEEVFEKVASTTYFTTNFKHEKCSFIVRSSM
jgi:hypothetical protein